MSVPEACSNQLDGGGEALGQGCQKRRWGRRRLSQSLRYQGGELRALVVREWRACQVGWQEPAHLGDRDRLFQGDVVGCPHAFRQRDINASAALGADAFDGPEYGESWRQMVDVLTIAAQKQLRRLAELLRQARSHQLPIWPPSDGFRRASLR